MVWTRQSLFPLAEKGHFSAQLGTALLSNHLWLLCSKSPGRAPLPCPVVPSPRDGGQGPGHHHLSPQGPALGRIGIGLGPHLSTPLGDDLPACAKNDAEGILWAERQCLSLGVFGSEALCRNPSLAAKPHGGPSNPSAWSKLKMVVRTPATAGDMAAPPGALPGVGPQRPFTPWRAASPPS